SGDHRALYSFPTRRSSDLGDSRDPRVAEAVGRSKQSRANRRRALDRLDTKGQILPDVPRTMDMQLPMKVLVIPDRMPFIRHSLRSEEHTSELQSPYDLVCR